jgi:hypothetical protein
MREYLRPGFTQERQTRELAKLEAILQALNNCNRALGTIEGGEEAFLAREDLLSAYQRVTRLHQEKARNLNQNALPPVVGVVDIECEDAWEGD